MPYSRARDSLNAIIGEKTVGKAGRPEACAIVECFAETHIFSID
jgi:hypothetical protein